MNTKKIFSLETLTYTLLTFFVFSLFFPIRKVFITDTSNLLGKYSDFTSISWYFLDMLTILLTSITFYVAIKNLTTLKDYWRDNKKWLVFSFILFFWLCFEAILNFKQFDPHSYWFLSKLVLLIVAYGTFIKIFQNKAYLRYFSYIFILFGSTQVFIALLQFFSQGSIGLHILGESLIQPEGIEIAKIIVGDKAFIRPYGTFPHPNVLSSFFITSILLSYGVFLVEKSRKIKISLILAIFLLIFGLGLTFSRGAYLAFIISSAVFFGYLFFSKNQTGWVKYLLGAVLISILFTSVSLGSFLKNRADINDDAIAIRGKLSQAGIKMVINKPILGFGPGNNIKYITEYANEKLLPWEKQPIHNYQLLSATEFGVFGSLLLLIFFLFHVEQLYLRTKTLKSPIINEAQEIITHPIALPLSLMCALISLLILMQVDHYLYTLEQGQFLLWILLSASAVVSSETKNPYPPAGGGDSTKT